MIQFILMNAIFKYILVYLSIYNLYWNYKPINITTHALKRARQRDVAFPDQVYAVLRTGRVFRFGKQGIKFIKRTKHGSIICIGEDCGDVIIIKTLERGN